MPLHTLLDDEQKAFEEKFTQRLMDIARVNWETTVGKDIAKWLALHDQKIITAVIEMVEKLIDENDDGMWAGRETADRIKSTLQQALKKV